MTPTAYKSYLRNRTPPLQKSLPSVQWMERCAYLKGCATLLTSLVLLHLWMNCMLEDYKAPEEEGLKTDKVMKKMDIISGTLWEYIKILKSEEGQMLRRKHQTTVKLLRQMLMDSGFPVVHCPNHIILVQIG
ncbi:uncharacterized protein LOC101469253 isoform X2 [Maylandia zebra]|uniref:uncharacterized protein LOC101469253 isoform X2 n=1 Tax=Maylandia zebra TaxID=106582 RepID=UPI00403C76E1